MNILITGEAGFVGSNLAIEEGYDIAYGSRFTEGGATEGYPKAKMCANRLFNNTERLLFRIKYMRMEANMENVFLICFLEGILYA